MLFGRNDMAPIIDTNDKALRVLDAAGIPYKLVESVQSPSRQSQSSKSKKSKYILLDREHQNGNYSEVDLLIPFKITYLNIKWEECKTPILLASEQGYMPTIRQHLDFLELIKSGEAFDEYGYKIDSKLLENLFDEITAQRDPWRGEWLDAQFGNRTITYHKILQNGSVREITESLDDCLMEDKSPGISLDSWIKTANSYGLPTENTADGSLLYLAPRSGTVAWFVAFSSWTVLRCNANYYERSSTLGVRVTKRKIF